jgi:hypothetical protein
MFSFQIQLVATERPTEDGFIRRPGFAPNCLYIRNGDQIINNSYPASFKGDVITSSVAVSPHPFLLLAAQNQSIGRGDTLNLETFFPALTINASRQIAFISGVNSASGRNQGVFVSNGSKIQPIVFGCGSGGGGIEHGTCGDQTPIGGTFSGFFREESNMHPQLMIKEMFCF